MYVCFIQSSKRTWKSAHRPRQVDGRVGPAATCFYWTAGSIESFTKLHEIQRITYDYYVCIFLQVQSIWQTYWDPSAGSHIARVFSVGFYAGRSVGDSAKPPYICWIWYTCGGCDAKMEMTWKGMKGLRQHLPYAVVNRRRATPKSRSRFRKEDFDFDFRGMVILIPLWTSVNRAVAQWWPWVSMTSTKPAKGFHQTVSLTASSTYWDWCTLMAAVIPQWKHVCYSVDSIVRKGFALLDLLQPLQLTSLHLCTLVSFV